MNGNEEVEDKIRGVIFGQAISDALGVGAEFKSKEWVSRRYPGGLRDYGDIERDGVAGHFEPGEWTDDSAQMLCIMDSLLDKGGVDPQDIAAKFLHWARTDGRGMGRLTRAIFMDSDFKNDPHGAARRAWEASGKSAAPNGGVMRTSVLGTWDYWSPVRVAANAENACRVTHWDPRCVASCVGVSMAISGLLSGKTEEQSMEAAMSAAKPIHEEVESWSRKTLDELRLDERASIGYTYKTAGAGLWSLWSPKSFEEGLVAVIGEGGDADTNAAVAGAVLGARFGLKGIPERLISGLYEGGQLAARVDRLVKVLAERKAQDR